MASPTTYDFNSAELPFVLASSVALIVLSSAAEVVGGEGLLRGHVCLLAGDRGYWRYVWLWMVGSVEVFK